jgi:hypothetical protein
MRTRPILVRVFLIALMTVALWAWGGGVASAQDPCGCTGEICPPCPIVVCGTPVPPDEGDCDGPCPPGFPPDDITCTGFYTPDQRANVFTFGPNNSIQVKFDAVTCPFALQVTLTPTTQEAFQPRVTHVSDTSDPSVVGICTFSTANPPYPPAPDITCNETVIVGAVGQEETFCAVYSVSFAPTTCYTQGPKVVGYTIGWLDPEAKGNKHDYMLLRDPDGLHPSEVGDPTAATACFTQDITNRLLRNYTVGTIVDPGLGGLACCTSDYVVAKQRVRPVRK